jgi:23S rRNA pseudouridine1911/1915/1917 synthase
VTARSRPRGRRSERSSAATEFLVTEAEAGLRLDALLVRKGMVASVAAARRLLNAGRVRLGGPAGVAQKVLKKGLRVPAGAHIEVTAATETGAVAVVPDPKLPLVVLFEDEHVVAVDKPAGIPSHPLRPGERRTVASALVARYPECADASEDPREGGLAHRLDVGTSGVLLAARSRPVWRRLRQVLARPECEKIYLAEVVGAPGAHVTIEKPIGRVGRRAGRVRVGGGRGLLPARTEVHTLARRAETTLIEARLSRGRAHQIRVHLASIGCPVVGDETYGGEPSRHLAQAGGGGLRLHAAKVAFAHPVTGRRTVVRAPPPIWATRRKR